MWSPSRSISPRTPTSMSLRSDRLSNLGNKFQKMKSRCTTLSGATGFFIVLSISGCSPPAKECLDGGEHRKRTQSPPKVSPPEQSDVTGIAPPAATASSEMSLKQGQSSDEACPKRTFKGLNVSSASPSRLPSMSVKN